MFWKEFLCGLHRCGHEFGVWDVLTDGILSEVRSVEPVAGSDHEEVADKEPVRPSHRINDRVRC